MNNHIGDANKMVGAAQEAAGWQVFNSVLGAWQDASKSQYEGRKSHYPDEARELFAAPVAAAPVDLSRLARFSPSLEFGSAQMAGDASGDYVFLDDVRELLIDACPKGGNDFGAMTDLLARWRHNAAIEPSPNPVAKARREVWVQCLSELEAAMQATSAEVGA